MATSYQTYYDRYKELKETYKIAYSARGLSNDEFAAHDIVVEHIGFGYAHSKYRVMLNKPNLSTKDLAIICDKGNLCFGYRVEGNIICVHTD